MPSNSPRPFLPVVKQIYNDTVKYYNQISSEDYHYKLWDEQFKSTHKNHCGKRALAKLIRSHYHGDNQYSDIHINIMRFAGAFDSAYNHLTFYSLLATFARDRYLKDHDIKM